MKIIKENVVAIVLLLIQIFIWSQMINMMQVLKDGAANAGLIFITTALTVLLFTIYLIIGLSKRKLDKVVIAILMLLPEVMFWIVGL